MSEKQGPLNFGTPASLLNNPLLGGSIVGTADGKTTFLLTQEEQLQLAALESASSAADETLASMLSCAHNMHTRALTQNNILRGNLLRSISSRLKIKAEDDVKLSVNVSAGVVYAHKRGNTDSSGLASALSEIIGSDIDPKSIKAVKIPLGADGKPDMSSLSSFIGDAAEVIASNSNNLCKSDEEILAGVHEALKDCTNQELSPSGLPDVSPEMHAVIGKVLTQKVNKIEDERVIEMLMRFALSFHDLQFISDAITSGDVLNTEHAVLITALIPLHRASADVLAADNEHNVNIRQALAEALYNKDKDKIDLFLDTVFSAARKGAAALADDRVPLSIDLVSNLINALKITFFSTNS